MKVKVVRDFRDLENNNQLRKIGEIYDCKKERADLLVSKGFAVVVKEEVKKEVIPFADEVKEEFVPAIEEEVIEEKPKKKAPKKTTKKKSDK